MILFTPPSAQRILTGEKTMTARFRKGAPPKVGSIHQAKTGYKKENLFAFIEILKVTKWDGKIQSVTQEIAEKEGFNFPSEFYQSYRLLNTHTWHENDRTHYFIEFKLTEEKQ